MNPGPFSGSIGSGFAGGFVGGFAQSASQQLGSGGQFSWSNAGRAALMSGAIGGLTGGAFYGGGQLLGMAGSGGPSLAGAMIGGGTRQLAAASGAAWALGASSGMAGALGGGGFQAATEFNSVSARQEAWRRKAYKYSYSESRLPKPFPTSKNTWWLEAIRGARGMGKQLVARRMLMPLRQEQRLWMQRLMGRGYSPAEIEDRMRSSLIDSGWQLGQGQLPRVFRRMLNEELSNPKVW